MIKSLKNLFIAFSASVALLMILPAFATTKFEVSQAVSTRSTLSAWIQEEGYSLDWKLERQDISLTSNEVATINRKLSSATTVFEAMDIFLSNIDDRSIRAEIYENKVIVLRDIWDEQSARHTPSVNSRPDEGQPKYTMTVLGTKQPNSQEVTLAELPYLTKHQCADFVRSAILSKNWNDATKAYGFVRATCSVVTPKSNN